MTIYTVKDVAQMFKVHEMTVRRWVKEGKLPSKKTGSLRFTEQDIKTFMKNTKNKVN